MDGHNRVAGIIFAGEQAFSFQAVDKISQRINLAVQVGVDVLAFAPQVEIGGNIFAPAHQIGLGRQHILQTFLLAHHLLGFLWIRPKARVGSLLFDFG